uniref:TspB protein n=1 Tax=viral metagenome TaxID=1070528 RepID=A0A6H1Z6V7_9ZZZZ
MISDIKAECWSDNTNTGRVVTRYGTTCPPGTENSPETGECLPPDEDPCLPTTGNKIGHRHKLGEIALGTIATTPPPPSVCTGNCRYSDPEMDGKPYRFVSGDPSGAWANFSYFGDGVSCQAGETEADAPSDKKPVADKTNECTNKVCLTVDESGNCQQYTYSCTATEKYTDPGNMDCDFGEFNGQSTCVPNSPSPKMTEKTTQTDVEVKENSDGSKDTKTTTTTTTTNCSGVGSCDKSTTTNVSNNKTNPDGSDGGTTESCTGDNCKDADGKTQEEREEEEENKPSVSGENCDVPVACEGDVIQCAILRQQKAEVCATEEAMDWEGNKQQVTDAVQGEQYQVKEELIEAPSFISSGTRFLSSGCPSPRRVNLLMGGSVEMDFAPFCSFAEGLAPVIVSCALLFAALYVGRGVGG